MVDQLRPSSSDIWTKCAAQPLIIETHVGDEIPSDEAMEGTCAAWLAQVVLDGQAETCRDMVGQVCPENNWPVDHTMANHIQGYVDMIKKRGGAMQAERFVRLNEFIAGTPDAYAVVNTADPVKLAFGEATEISLDVDDLKYGFGIVSPISCQVAIYSGAIFNELVAKGVRISKINIGIYQPRGFHPDGIYRTRTITPRQLITEIEWIIAMGRKCLEPEPMATPGSHCKHCKGAHVCPAISSEMYDIVTMMRGTTARELTEKELAEQLAFIDLAEDMLKGLKTAVHADANGRLNSGKRIPGWGRRRGRGRKKFKIDAAAIKLFTGIDATAGNLCTPAELERRGADPDILEIITTVPETKAKLVPVTADDTAKKFGE